MTITDANTIEATGSAFELDGYMAVRARTRKAVHMIADQITPGLSEEQAKEIARTTLSRARDAPGLAPHHRALRSQHDQGLHGAF